MGKQQRFMSDRELAERYAVTRQTVWRWVQLGLFPAPVRLSPGCTRWRLDQIEEHENARTEAESG